MNEWKEKKLKSIADIRVSNVDKKIYPNKSIVRLCNYMDVYRNDYINDRLSFSIGSADGNQLQRFALRENDVIITKDSETPEDIAVPAVVVEKLNNIVCGYHLAILRPNSDEIDGAFLMQMLKLPELQRYFYSVANGSTRYGLTIGNIENAIIKYPHISVQRKIANIIHEIDNVIHRTQAAISKYQVIKQGMLHDLFTRGIDIKTGKLRPTYREAPKLYMQSESGMIPKEWSVQRLSGICSMKSGEGITSKSISEIGAFPVYGGNGLRGYTTTFTHEGNYVLIGRQGALCGNITRVTGQFYASEHAVVVTVDAIIDVDWLSQLLGTMNLNQYSEASAQPGLSVSKILKLKIIIPDYEEQCLIAGRLVQADNKINAEHAYLQKLRQIKSGLMNDLLSGKKKINVNKHDQTPVHKSSLARQ